MGDMRYMALDEVLDATKKEVDAAASAYHIGSPMPIVITVHSLSIVIS